MRKDLCRRTTRQATPFAPCREPKIIDHGRSISIPPTPRVFLQQMHPVDLDQATFPKAFLSEYPAPAIFPTLLPRPNSALHRSAESSSVLEMASSRVYEQFWNLIASEDGVMSNTAQMVATSPDLCQRAIQINHDIQIGMGKQFLRT